MGYCILQTIEYNMLRRGLWAKYLRRGRKSLKKDECFPFGNQRKFYTVAVCGGRARRGKMKRKEIGWQWKSRGKKKRDQREGTQSSSLGS